MAATLEPRIGRSTTGFSYGLEALLLRGLL
jgi:hypothetical protein